MRNRRPALGPMRSVIAIFFAIAVAAFALAGAARGAAAQTPSLNVTVAAAPDPLRLDEQAAITVRVTFVDGTPAAGASVTVTASLLVDPATGSQIVAGSTDANGVALFTMAPTQSGTSTVTATARTGVLALFTGSTDSTVSIVGPPADLSVSMDPPRIQVGSAATLTIAVRDASGSPVPREALRFVSNPPGLVPTSARTDDAGALAPLTVRPTTTGTLSVAVTTGNDLTRSATLDVAPAPVVELAVTTLSVDGATARITIANAGTIGSNATTLMLVAVSLDGGPEPWTARVAVRPVGSGSGITLDVPVDLRGFEGHRVRLTATVNPDGVPAEPTSANNSRSFEFDVPALAITLTVEVSPPELLLGETVTVIVTAVDGRGAPLSGVVAHIEPSGLSGTTGTTGVAHTTWRVDRAGIVTVRATGAGVTAPGSATLIVHASDLAASPPHDSLTDGGHTLLVEFDVTNAGDATSPESSVDVVLRGQQETVAALELATGRAAALAAPAAARQRVPLPALDPGDTRTIRAAFPRDAATGTRPGEAYVVDVTLDPDNAVLEGDETNNRASATATSLATEATAGTAGGIDLAAVVGGLVTVALGGAATISLRRWLKVRIERAKWTVNASDANPPDYCERGDAYTQRSLTGTPARRRVTAVCWDRVDGDGRVVNRRSGLAATIATARQAYVAIRDRDAEADALLLRLAAECAAELAPESGEEAKALALFLVYEGARVDAKFQRFVCVPQRTEQPWEQIAEWTGKATDRGELRVDVLPAPPGEADALAVRLAPRLSACLNELNGATAVPPTP